MFILLKEKNPETSRALNFFHLDRKWCFAAEDKSHMQARVEIGKENTTLLHSPHLKVERDIGVFVIPITAIVKPVLWMRF